MFFCKKIFCQNMENGLQRVINIFYLNVEMWKTFSVEKVEKNVEKWLFFYFLSRNPQSFPQVFHNLWKTLRKPKK